MKKRIISIAAAVLLLTVLFTGCVTDDTQTSMTPAPEGILSVHFLDVGQADCALLVCGGETMLIDGGNVDDGDFVYSYLKSCGISHLDYVISTHAHEDHVGGLTAALNACTAGTVMSPVTEYDSRAFENFAEAVYDQGLSLTMPEPETNFTLGTAEVQVLGPLYEYEETNDTSIVLRVVFGDTSFLFTGDAESEAEHDLVESGQELQSTVLKVGHHGSRSSTEYVFLREVMPEYAVISVGTDNEYGHPTEEVLSRLRDADVTLYRTDMQGTVIAESDGKTVTFETDKNSSAATNPTVGQESDEALYIGNKNSQKFHLTTCDPLPQEQNQVEFYSREEAVNAGYEPCGKCNP